MASMVQRCLAVVPVLVYLFLRIVIFTIFSLNTSSKHAMLQPEGVEELGTITPTYNARPAPAARSVGFNGGTYITNNHMMMNCSTIQDIGILQKLGNGVSKQGYLGEYRGRKVVMKVIKRDALEISNCYKDFNWTTGMEEICQQFPREKMMYEILLLHELSHPNIAQLLGYCAKDNIVSYTDVRYNGLITVTEFGKPVTESLKFVTWVKQIQYAIGLVDLLVYFEHSPLGSINHADYKAEHFKIFNDTLKTIDLDMILSQDRKCTQSTQCSYGVVCQSGRCYGSNARRNLLKFQETFSSSLLRPSNYPAVFVRDLVSLNQSIAEFAINAELLLEQLTELGNKGLMIEN